MNENVTQQNIDLLKNKLNNLWRDKRKYTTRLLTAAAVSFVMCFTFLFFGPIEMVSFNATSFSLTLMDIIPIMSVTMVIITVVLSFLLSALRGRVYNYIVTAVFSIALCGYIQGNFLNGKLDSLTGDSIAWEHRKFMMVVNIIIWIAIFIIPFLCLYFSEKIWRKSVVFISILLVIMQTVALVTIMITPNMLSEDQKKNYLSTKEMFTYSKENNTLLFVLDRLDYVYIEKVLAEDPTFLNKLDGFTSYTNAISEFARTTPAANFMLTGAEKSAYQMPAAEYYDTSWESEGVNILKDLNDANYKVDIYSTFSSMFGDGKKQKKYVDNMTNVYAAVVPQKIAEKLAYLSLYRYAPVIAKPFFWSYTDNVNDGIRAHGTQYKIDEKRYNAGISKFKSVSDTNYFKYYHFMGSHTPYTLKRDGTKATENTTVLDQTMGSFQILFNAFDKMKKMGLYEGATIIIVGDHGSIMSNTDPHFKPSRIGMFYKPAGKIGTPLAYSHAPVSLKNIPSTIIKSAGLDYKNYGKPIDEVAENEKVTRHLYKGIYPSYKRPETDLYVYSINGDATKFSNWKIDRIDKIIYPYY